MTSKNLDIQSLFSLSGKVALVTGGYRGIGRMITQGLLQAGAKVYVSGRKKEPCQQAAKELSEFGECIAIAADVTDAESRQQLCDSIARQEPHLNILINNAGAAWGDTYESYPVAAFETLMATNVTAVFALTRQLTPMLEIAADKADPARVINLGSMDGLHIPTVHGMGTYAYTASKAAVHQLTRHLAVDLGRRNITVNAIAPGFFPSKMTEYVFENFAEQIATNSLLGRTGEDQEMAGIAIYLCSRAGAYTHGAVIPVDGGTSINHQHVGVNE